MTGWITHVVREGGKVDQPLTDRARRRLRREYVYARRDLRRYELVWLPRRTLVGTQWILAAGGVVATVQDHGIMSYCHVEVDGRGVRHRHSEEEMAGFGGLDRAILRGTQHVLALLEERAAFAAKAIGV